MKKSQQGTKDFFLGAFIGGLIGITAASLSKQKNKQLFDSLTEVGKALSITTGKGDLAQIIDWTSEGIEVWNKMKKSKKGR